MSTTKTTDFRPLVCFLACALLYCWHTIQYDYLSDDTYITLRYAKNMAEGHGPVFNLGDPVEGYTSTLWTVLLAGTYKLGLDLVSTSRVLGGLFGLLAMALAMRLVRVLGPEDMPPLLPCIVPFLMACNGSFACWAGSGMETMLYVFLIVLGFLLTFEKRHLAASLVAALLILIRPEGIVIVGTLGLYHLVRMKDVGLKFIVLWSLPPFVALAGLISFRLTMFGDWLPNTYYAKMGGGHHAVSRGFDYLTSYASMHESLLLMLLPAIAVVVLGTLQQRFLLLGAVLLWAGVISAGGDGLCMYRFALGPLPLLLVLQVILLGQILSKLAARGTPQLILLGALALILGYTAYRVPKNNPRYGLYHYQQTVEIPRWRAVGQWLRANASEDASFCAVPIGAVSYYSELRCYDMVGLTDKHIAHKEIETMGQGWAGHEKTDGPYILRQRPTYLLLNNIDVTSKPRDPANKPFIQYANRSIWEREKDFYLDDTISKHYRPRSAEIGPGMFLNYYELIE